MEMNRRSFLRVMFGAGIAFLGVSTGMLKWVVPQKVIKGFRPKNYLGGIKSIKQDLILKSGKWLG